MPWFDASVLGLIQGLTEFIPVSSSGHLILAREWLGMTPGASDLGFDAVLQLATSFAVLAYFRRDIAELARWFFTKISGKPIGENQQTLWLALAFGTIPAVLAGLLLESSMETIFRSSTLVAWTLLVGAALMFVADTFGKQGKELSLKKGFIVGLFQILALVPGISRSGAPISGGVLVGLTREVAIRFSFLLSFPILFGSGLKKLLDLYQTGALSVLGLDLFLGSLIAFASGLAAIHFLVKYLKHHNLSLFIWYRVALAAVALLILQ